MPNSTATPATEEPRAAGGSVLVRDSVTRTLFSMALPMLAGTFAMNAYSLTDAWFIGRLGTVPLAAMGFILPVVMLITCVARGVGSGVTTLVSSAIGRQDHDDAARLTTHGIVLTVIITVIMSVAGYLLTEPIFAGLGARAEMPLIRQFMAVWYFGAISMTLPMVGSGVLISVGDSRGASLLMIVGTMINLALNPLLIFGYLGLPAMGITGSALATVIAQSVSALWMMHLLSRKFRLLKWSGGLAESGWRITVFAVPSILSMILMPVSATVVTRILSEFGSEAVAASGVAGRIEMFAFVVPMALGISLGPFVSQNFGAGSIKRVREAQSVSTMFALLYGGFVAVLFFVGARWLASAFTKDPEVARILVAYIRIICFGYGMMEIHRYCGFFLTGMYKPASATALNAIRVLVLLIPCSYAGARFWGIEGLFAGRLITDLIAGSIGLIWVARVLRLPPTSTAARQ